MCVDEILHFVAVISAYKLLLVVYSSMLMYLLFGMLAAVSFMVMQQHEVLDGCLCRPLNQV
jgi:hypothetical protein